MNKSRIKLSLFSLVLALLLFGFAIKITGREPLHVYWSIIAGSFGSLKGFLNVLAYMTPLILTGLGAAVAFQSGVFNIGGEGQVLIGGLASVIVGLLLPVSAPWGYLVAMLAGLDVYKRQAPSCAAIGDSQILFLKFIALYRY